MRTGRRRVWGAAQRGFAALTRVGLLPTLGKENLASARNLLGKHVFCLDFGVHLSYRNILETGRVGLLLLVPGLGETLRINGRAALITDSEWLTPLTVQGKHPMVAVAVEVDECFLQCAKAIIRSKLWEPHERPALQTLPCAAEMLHDHVKLPEFDVTKVQTLLDEAYRNKLY